MIKINNLTIGYQNKAVLNDVNLTIEQGKIIGLIGKSGCGKTTLLKSLYNHNLILDGEILFDNLNIKKSSKKQINKLLKSVQVVSNDDFMLEEYDLVSNVLLTFNNYNNVFYKILKILSKKQVGQLLELLDELNIKEFAFKKFKDLSQGQKQRAILIKALFNQFDILILDEPTSALDINNANLVMQKLNSLKINKYIILAIHDLNLALEYCDTLVAIKDNKVQAIINKNDFNQEDLIKYFD
ncbi:ATP-binding cassette domain-containing protein [Mycoplasma sp. NEAQ87857]|uniref:ABC transporter ATP-binding protein n=1 Tax=Mycoplasma sp. NEAQ87857 TaxID=2683967 RepID=UPI00131807DD|nr:ABC transporter ATP-binding protein [Mycoplasma sp. NEAQ87857]QGZ97354.1 ATP-binding cassette domain-containing protein [Mycoplasma sp. NEAQ87857]